MRLKSINDLALHLGIPSSEISYCCENRARFVRIFKKTVKGKSRTFIEAKGLLHTIQNLIKTAILDPLPTSSSVHGYTKGRSNVTHAREHAGARIVLRFDIADFFPSILTPRVHKMFTGIGISGEATNALVALTTFRGSLPLGFCTSPKISTCVTGRLIHRLERLSEKHGVTFSVYADNFEFSAHAERIERLRPLIARIIAQEGFQVNKAKSIVLGRHSRKEITGVVVNAGPSWGRDRRRAMRARIHALSRSGLPGDASKRAKVLAELRGYAAYVHSINQEQADRIRRQIEHLEQLP